MLAYKTVLKRESELRCVVTSFLIVRPTLLTRVVDHAPVVSERESPDGNVHELHELHEFWCLTYTYDLMTKVANASESFTCYSDHYQ